jgi:hypothetical protein
VQQHERVEDGVRLRRRLEQALSVETEVVVPGALPLSSNEEDGRWSARPNTILVDSEQLESGDAMSADFKKIAAAEIEEFKAEYRARFPGRSTDDLHDEDLLRPRDPSLDPKLVWKGKDEQDAAALEVPVVPIYIQEKVHPQALVENLRDTAKAGELESERTLFDDFNGMDDARFDKKVDFYHHDHHWSNRMILGDSLLVMTSLAEKEGLKGKVQTIYFDPPYGIKFGSNWQVSTRKRDVKDGKVEDATCQPEQIRAFRDTWKLGVHSYLAYLRDRLVVARDLLTESGSIFVQIGDENVHLVRCVLDEVFGAENSISLLTLKKTTGGTGDFIPGSADYLVWYAKQIGSAQIQKHLHRDGAWWCRKHRLHAGRAPGRRPKAAQLGGDPGSDHPAKWRSSLRSR